MTIYFHWMAIIVFYFRTDDQDQSKVECCNTTASHYAGFVLLFYVKINYFTLMQ